MKTTMTTKYKGFVIEIVLEDEHTKYVVKKGGRIIEEGQPAIQDTSEALDEAKEMIDELERDEPEQEEHDDTPSLNDTFDHARNP